MRDIIWTIILVWLVWRIYDAFKAASRMQTQRVNNRQQQNAYQQNRNSRREGEVRIDSTETAHKSHFKPGDGEYVDYEEVK